MLIHDRGNRWNVYSEIGFGLTIDATYEDEKGTINEWVLSKAPNTRYHGYDVEEFLELLDEFKDEYNLKQYSKAKKDLIVIYTDNIEKFTGFFWSHLTDQFSNLYVQIKDFFEIRPINAWKEIEDSLEIANYAQYLIDNLFIPNKYYYLTPNQVPRRQIAKACDEDTAAKLFPVSYEEYTCFRKALFGGIVYVPYKNLVVTDQLMCLDLTSAYIYDLLVEKHCNSPFERVDTDLWEFYTESDQKTSLGNYTITYTCVTNKIHCFKTIDGNNFETGTNTVNCTMTSVDLATFMKLANVHQVECHWLYESTLKPLPRYMRDEIVKQYIKKVDLKGDEEAYNLQKPIVNGIFGDCIRNYDEKAFYDAARKPSVAPQWGIWCTSYAKKNLLDLGLKVEGWMYSDTDSIYCFNNEYNRKLVEEYNKVRMTKVYNFCLAYGYDFEKLKDLGSFKIEKVINKFRAITQKVYMYETEEGEFKLTAAGLNQKTITVDKSLFDKPKLDYGGRLFKFVGEDNYYEKMVYGEEMILLSIMQAKGIPEQY